jgi:hypothetical protein
MGFCSVPAVLLVVMLLQQVLHATAQQTPPGAPGASGGQLPASWSALRRALATFPLHAAPRTIRHHQPGNCMAAGSEWHATN